MRVALFTDSDVFAGTESYIFDLGRGLRDLGVEVRIACPTPSVLAERAGGEAFSILPIPKGGLIDREAIRTLSGLLRAGEIDVVHANNGRTMLSSAMAVARAGKGASIATQHFLEPDHVTRRGLKAVLSHVRATTRPTPIKIRHTPIQRILVTFSRRRHWDMRVIEIRLRLLIA